MPGFTAGLLETPIQHNGDIFRDPHVDHEKRPKTKLGLANAINQILKARRLSQPRTAEILGINQPKVSALARHKLDGFSVERLMTFLTALDCDVEIVIHPKTESGNAGQISVVSDHR